jgi:integrase
MAKRMRGMYKQKNSAVWWCCYKGLDGKVVRKSTGKIDYNEAVEFLVSARREVKAGNEPEVKRIGNHTFNELADEYLKWSQRQRGFRSKAGIVDQLKERFGDVMLRQFNTLLLEQYQTKRLQQGAKHKTMKKNGEGKQIVCESGRLPKGNKPATINRHIATIKHIFTKAVEWEMVEEATMKKVHKVKLLEENNRRLRYLSAEECQKLLTECGPHLKPIVTVALNTGMRKGEILGLTWDSVDLKHGFILLEKTKNGERREIPINATVRATLTRTRSRLDVKHVFYDAETCKPYGDVKKGFNAAVRRAGLRDFHFHDLRHTFASHLVMAGQDITTVKELLGHKTLAMTLRYAHLAPSHKVKAVDMLDGILNENSTSYLVHSLEVAK